MTPKLLSQWADENGIPRRTAYNWAKNGKLNVPLHRTLTGRLMVLDDTEQPGDAHPFVAAYSEALGDAVAIRERDIHHSPLLEAWGVSLYDAVDETLRPVVLQLAIPAACHRLKGDAPARFSDWIGRVELADWYIACGFPEAASRVAQRGEIVDGPTFYEYWPTGVASTDWWTAQDAMVERCLEQAGLEARASEGGAAEVLAEDGLVGLDDLRIAARRMDLRQAMDKLIPGGDAPPDCPLPESGDLWDIRGLYSQPMWALARPATRHTARLVCDLVGWDPESPGPPDDHPLREIGFWACIHAALTALLPHQHAAHLREIDAFRRIALGKPFKAIPK
jgi:hypothetical protein